MTTTHATTHGDVVAEHSSPRPGTTSCRLLLEGNELGFAAKRNDASTWSLSTPSGMDLLASPSTLDGAAVELADHRAWERNELPVLVECPTCGYAMADMHGQPSDTCRNPCCLSNPSLSEATRAMIQANHERYVADEAARAERQRLYSTSFARRSA